MIVEKNELKKFASDFLDGHLGYDGTKSFFEMFEEVASLQENPYLRAALFQVLDRMKIDGHSWVLCMKELNEPEIFHQDFLDLMWWGATTPSSPHTRSVDVALRKYIAS